MAEDAATLWQASEVSLRWSGRQRFTVLAIGDSALAIFVTAWAAWRVDPRRCERLDVIVVGAGVPAVAATPLVATSESSLQALLSDALPPSTPDLHRLAFEDGRVQLLICPDDASRALRDIVATVDAFLIESVGNDEDLLAREPRHAKALARLAAPEATLTTGLLATAAEGALNSVGFGTGDVGRTASAHPSPTPWHGRFAPRFTPRRLRLREAARTSNIRALIVGGGLAGCATAWALAERGWDSLIVERGPSIAGEASGNPAGLFHGIVNGQDGSHARFHRAAALEAHTAAACAIANHRVAGGLDGLLQLVDDDQAVDAMRALLNRLRLPASYVQALDQSEASARAGVRIERAAWFYPGGGWIAPHGLARSFVERAGSHVDVRTSTPVASLARADDRWHALDASGRLIASAEVVVLAGGGESLRLTGGSWPVEPVRGQISMLPIDARSDLQWPRLPLTGAGFLLPEIEGRAIFGATSDLGDAGTDIRPGDHQRNLRQLARLLPSVGANLDDMGVFEARAATRWVSRDRLPLVGAMPPRVDVAPDSVGRISRPDTLRLVPREPGLYVFTALGSRGITWAALGGQIIAALVSGAPSPVGARLLDAIDPARFAVRERQRQNR